MWTMSSSGLKSFVSQYAILEWQDLSFQKCISTRESQLMCFTISILKVARQCEFSNIDERLIDAIIFGTNCIKAQDKLLQTPKTLSLQQCLSVVRHYKSLKLHIQQIRPDKSIEYLRQHHSGKKKGSGQPQSNNQNQNQRGCSQSHSRQGQSQQKTAPLNKDQCFGCGQNYHQDKSECPAFGKTCHKCGRSNHFVSVCGKIPYRRSSFRSKS